MRPTAIPVLAALLFSGACVADPTLDETDAFGSMDCSSPSFLNRPRVNDDRPFACFVTTLAPGQDMEEISLTATNGAFDLYAVPNRATSIPTSARLNAAVVTGTLRVLLPASEATTWTLAVVRREETGGSFDRPSFDLAPASPQTHRPPGFLLLTPLAIGAEAGDEVVAALPSEATGQVEGQISWQSEGVPSQLSATVEMRDRVDQSREIVVDVDLPGDEETTASVSSVGKFDFPFDDDDRSNVVWLHLTNDFGGELAGQLRVTLQSP